MDNPGQGGEHGAELGAMGWGCTRGCSMELRWVLLDEGTYGCCMGLGWALWVGGHPWVQHGAEVATTGLSQALRGGCMPWLWCGTELGMVGQGDPVAAAWGKHVARWDTAKHHPLALTSSA